MMYCIHCGASYEGAPAFCAACGQSTAPMAMPVDGPPAGSMEDSRGMRMLLPVGRSGWAIAAGYLGLFAVLLGPAPIAVAISCVAIRDLRKNRRLRGMGRAMFGLIMGVLGTVVLVLMIAT